jgi:hypothetical protein
MHSRLVPALLFAALFAFAFAPLAANAPLAVKDALRYYSTFQTSRSAENSALLVWSVLLQSQKGQPLCAPSVLPRQEL